MSAALGSRYNLRLRNDEWFGSCPIKKERVPSFHVDAASGNWRCSICEAVGTPARLLEIVEGLDYPDAIATLIGRPLKAANDGFGNRALRSIILSANDFAADFFRAYRQTHAGAAKGRLYLSDRGFSDEILDRFNIGYAPQTVDGHNAFASAFAAAGYSEDVGLKAGLLAESERGIYPFFRDRIIIPMRSQTGETIAFGGRSRVKHPRKYINTSLTPVHRKGAALYAMDVAAETIAQMGEAIIVEGYFDAVTMHSAGFANTVAALGTSFSHEQARSIHLLGASALACFDADDAGRRAAQRAKQTAEEVGLNLRTVTIPEGLDPDDIIRTGGAEMMRGLLAA